MGYALKDANMSVTRALPNGAASVSSDGIDLGHDGKGDFLIGCELLIEAPALATADLGDAVTMTYDIEHSADNSTFTTLADNILVQTGAGGAGAAATEARFRMPTNVKRYVRVKATNSAAGDASDKSVTFSVVF